MIWYLWLPKVLDKIVTWLTKRISQLMWVSTQVLWHSQVLQGNWFRKWITKIQSIWDQILALCSQTPAHRQTNILRICCRVPKLKQTIVLLDLNQDLICKTILMTMSRKLETITTPSRTWTTRGQPCSLMLVRDRYQQSTQLRSSFHRIKSWEDQTVTDL